MDLGNLYYLLVSAILSGNHASHGKEGYYFAENGFQSWKSIAEAIGTLGNGLGIFETSKVGDIDMQEVGDVFYGGSLRDAEAVLASK